MSSSLISPPKLSSWLNLVLIDFNPFKHKTKQLTFNEKSIKIHVLPQFSHQLSLAFTSWPLHIREAQKGPPPWKTKIGPTMTYWKIMAGTVSILAVIQEKLSYTKFGDPIIQQTYPQPLTLNLVGFQHLTPVLIMYGVRFLAVHPVPEILNLPLLHLHVLKHISMNWDSYRALSIRKVKKMLGEGFEPLTPAEEKSLGFWFNNQKKPKHNHENTDQSKSDYQLENNVLSLEAQAAQIYAQQADQLLQEYMDLKSDQKLDFLRNHVKENSFFIMRFMEERSSAPQTGFLENIIEICNEFKEQTSLQTKLFIRVCALHKKEELGVDSNLIRNAIVELASKTIDQKAAYGLLKLAFQNEISLKGFPIESLVTFQERYHHVFRRFYDSLIKEVDFQVKDCLPPTCFLFTGPFYEVLKERGSELHQNITPQYLPFFINLLAYSFEEEQETFNKFISLFKDLCLEIWGQQFDLIPLLGEVQTEEMTRNPLYFGSLQAQIVLFTQLLELIKFEEIDAIDDILISQLMKLDQEEYRQMKQQPRKININKDSMQQFHDYSSLFRKENPYFVFDSAMLTQGLDEVTKTLLEGFGLRDLGYIQLLSLRIMEKYYKQQKLFQQFETGMGKTTLNLLFMLKVVYVEGVRVFSVYESPELCFRDFDRLAIVAQKLGIRCSCIKQERDFDQIDKASIVFMSAQLFQQLSKYEVLINILSESMLALDEFDQTLFPQNVTVHQLSAFTLSKYLIAFTGSPLQDVQKNLISNYFDVNTLKYPHSERIEGRQNICMGEEVFSTRQEQLQRLLEICQEQTQKTPILLILDQDGVKKFKELSTRRIFVKDFTKATPVEIDSFFKTAFLKKANNMYFTCLLNSSQGRGLDPPSNAEVENAGGLMTIIAQIPVSIQEYAQFKGRTKRMCNKGQFHTVLWKKTELSCSDFLQYHLDMMKSQENLRLNNLFFQKSQSSVPPRVQNVVHGNSKFEQQPFNSSENLIIEDEELEVHDIDMFLKKEGQNGLGIMEDEEEKAPFDLQNPYSKSGGFTVSTTDATRSCSLMKDWKQKQQEPETIVSILKQKRKLDKEEKLMSQPVVEAFVKPGTKSKKKAQEKVLSHIENPIRITRSKAVHK